METEKKGKKGFTKQCASAKMHIEWGIKEELDKLRRVSSEQTAALLQLSGKKMSSFHKNVPKFCEGCISHLKEVRMDLFERPSGSVPGKHETDEPPIKVPKLNENCDAETMTDVLVTCDAGTMTDSIVDLFRDIDLSTLPTNTLKELCNRIGLILRNNT